MGLGPDRAKFWPNYAQFWSRPHRATQDLLNVHSPVHEGLPLKFQGKEESLRHSFESAKALQEDLRVLRYNGTLPAVEAKMVAEEVAHEAEIPGREAEVSASAAAPAEKAARPEREEQDDESEGAESLERQHSPKRLVSDLSAETPEVAPPKRVKHVRFADEAPELLPSKLL